MGAGFADGRIWVVSRNRVAFSTGSSWTEIAADDTRTLGQTLYGLAIAGDGTNVWAIGGRDGSDGERSDRAWGLTPDAAAWLELDRIDPARSSLVVVAGPDGKVYALGGSGDPSVSQYSAVVESYTGPPMSEEGQSWDPAPPDLPFGVFGHAAATLGDHVYVIGGRAFGGLLQSNLRWRPGDQAWSESANLALARSDFGAVGADDGRLYVVGGSEGSATTQLDLVEAYSPEVDHWFPVSSLVMGARSDLGVTVGPDGRIWAIGGNGTVPVGTVEVYGPRLAINPVVGPPGTQIQIAGTNFAANARISVRVSRLDSAEVASTETDAMGATTMPATFVVPVGTPVGTLTIFAVDDRSVFPVHVDFRIF